MKKYALLAVAAALALTACKSTDTGKVAGPLENAALICADKIHGVTLYISGLEKVWQPADRRWALQYKDTMAFYIQQEGELCWRAPSNRPPESAPTVNGAHVYNELTPTPK